MLGDLVNIITPYRKPNDACTVYDIINKFCKSYLKRAWSVRSKIENISNCKQFSWPFYCMSKPTYMQVWKYPPNQCLFRNTALYNERINFDETNLDETLMILDC